MQAERREARTTLFGTRARRIVLATGFLLGLAPNLYPATRTWDGGGSDSNITTGLNWVGDTAPGSGDSLYFAGSLRLTPLLNSNLSVNRLNFNSGAGAFVLGGTGIYTINRNGITNSSTNTQTIGNTIALSRNQSWKATSGDLVITGAVNTSGRRITFNGGKNSTLTNVVSGSGSITQSGVGALTLSGSNTYSGTTSLSAGTLIIGSNTALGTGALTITAGTLATNGTARTLTNTNTVNGSFTFNSPSDLTLSGTAALGNNITVTVSGVGALTFGGIVSGSTRILTKAGTGTLTLNVANTYSGGTVVNAGSLVIGHAQALGTGTASFGTATVSATGSAKFIANALQITGNTTFGGATDMTFNTGTTLTGSRTVTVNNANVILNGIVSGTGFALSKSGAGTLTLGGTSSNTFSGGANVNDGVLLLSKSATINAFSGSLVIGDGSGASRSAIARLNQINQIPDASGVTLASDGMLDLQTFTDTVASITANGGVITSTGGGRLDLGGNITVNGTGSLATLIEAALGLNASRTFLVNDNSVLGDADLTISGLISNGSAASGLTKTGLGTLLLNGANTFSGGTTLLNGTVLMDSSSTGSITNGPLGTGTILLGDTTGSNSAALLFSTTSGRSISNPITVRAGSSGTRTIGAMNTSGVSTYSSAITLNASALLSAASGGQVSFTGVLSGVGGVTKTGAGSVYFTNTNTLTGALVVQSGILNLSGANGKLSAVPSITIDAGANLTLDNTAGENFTPRPARPSH